MKQLKHYFGEQNITWANVILLAIATAVYTAVINLIPALKNTSFQDIAVYPDAWFLFAIFIIVNCKKWWEASLKCFVFFLISQPLIYLIEVPFSALSWGLFQYYKYWFVVTLLTLPGAAIAFQLKKKNWLSVLILSVATGYLSAACITHFDSALAHFPYHLLSAIFCLALSIFFVFVLLDRKEHRAAALGIIAAVIIALAASTWIFTGGSTTELLLEEGRWTCTIEDKSVAEVTVTDGNHAIITSKKNGSTTLCFENAAGSKQEYVIVIDGNSITTSLIE